MDFIPGVSTLGALDFGTTAMPFGLGGDGGSPGAIFVDWSYFDPFDYAVGSHATDIGPWVVRGGMAVIVDNIGWKGNAIRLYGDIGSTGANRGLVSLDTGTQTEYTVAFAWLPAPVSLTADHSQREFLVVKKGAHAVASLTVNPDRTISIYRGEGLTAVLLGMTDYVVANPFDWLYLELHIIIGTSGSFELRNYGQVILSGTDVNIDAVGWGTADNIALCGEGQAFDDFYVCNGLGYQYEARVAPYYVTETQFPVALGYLSELVPLLGHPDIGGLAPMEIVATDPPITADYLVSTAPWKPQSTTFLYGPLSVPPVKVLSVTSKVYAKATGVADVGFAHQCVSLGEVATRDFGAPIATSTSWAWYEYSSELNLATGLPWQPGAMIAELSSYPIGVTAKGPIAVSQMKRDVTYLYFGPSEPGATWSVSASTRVLFRADAHAYVSPIKVSAITTVNLSASADLATRFWQVSAATGFVMASSLSYVFNRAYDVSATTRVRLRAGAAAIANHTFDVSASTRIALTPAAALTGRFWEVAAANRIALRSSAQAIVNHTFNVSASTCLRLASAAALTGRFWEVAAATRVMMKSSPSAVVNHTWDVSASTSLGVRAVASSSRVCVVAASNAITLSQAAVSGRDLFVSASTSFGMSPGLKSNEFIGMSASGSFTMNASAGAYVTGTLAQSGFVMTGVAYATVVFPWRRQSLTLPPGGNLPHS